MDINARPVWVRKYGAAPAFRDFSLLNRSGYIGIGWPHIGDITELHTTALIRAALQEAAAPEEASRISRDAGILNAFINEAREGDMVACHNQEANRVFIGKLVGSCLYDERRHKHFHLLRRVEWMEPLHPGLYFASLADLDGRGVFWKIGNPETILAAYQTYGKYKMALPAIP